MSDRRLIVGALGLTLVVGLAACGGSASPTTVPAATAAPAVATAAPAATQAPAATDAPADSEIPDVSLAPGAAGDLEGMLPSSVGGLAFTKSSLDGSAIAAAGTPFDTSEMDPTLSKLGKGIGDVRFALATAAGGLPVIYALQIKGAPATDFVAAAGVDTSGMTQESVGGKSVYKADMGGASSFVYLKDDILFMVFGASDAQGQEILGSLP
jgi:hypothetical protein